MDINIPSRVRGWLYVFCGIGSLVMAYLAAIGVVGSNELALWTGFNAFIAGLARFNLSSKD